MAVDRKETLTRDKTVDSGVVSIGGGGGGKYFPTMKKTPLCDEAQMNTICNIMTSFNPDLLKNINTRIS